MGMIPPVLVEVADMTSVGDVRRRFAELSGRIGLDETATGRVAIIATEIASNLVKHAVPGSRVVGQATERHGRLAVELLGIDSGPGIDNVAQALRDGFSSTSTPGTGLGAVRRLADEFQLHSLPGTGTIVLARVVADATSQEHAAPPSGALELGAVAVPAPGESANGDAWAIERREDRTWVTVVDGLGHGPDAAVAAHAALRSFHRRAGAAPGEHVRAMHEMLRNTRGAAVAVAEIRADTREIIYAGLGNIAGVVIAPDGGTHNMVSHDGIAGHVAARIHEFTYAWPSGALLVMHSDGLTQRWDLGRYPGLARRDPSIIAAVLLRDSSRGRDDATVVVVRDSDPDRTGG
jgi:anti-sigma regulatory factor (Ser/Thr protein kinase)